MTDPEWTDADLALMQSLDAAGTGADEIARRLGRSIEAIRDHLPIVRSRAGTLPVPTPAGHDEGQDWYGPDEEGDVPPARDSADTDGWVHGKPEQPR